MKRFSMLALVLVLILGFSSVMFACGPANPNPCLPQQEKFTVVAWNPLQGVIEGLGGEVAKTFPCGDETEIEAIAPFSVRSNGFLRIELELNPFTSLTFTQSGMPKIMTTAKLLQGTAEHISVSSNNSKVSGSHDMVEHAGFLPSGRGVRNYKLVVNGKLGNIEDQAYGDYKAVVTVTLAAPEN
ncbi:MAG: hypothetical protein GX335_08940 [Firmicutes bacterium]|nr:hypothetical protein [Bacillota bacterium]